MANNFDLNAALSQAMSPISTYTQGLMALALQNKERQQRVEDRIAEEAFRERQLRTQLQAQKEALKDEWTIRKQIEADAQAAQLKSIAERERAADERAEAQRAAADARIIKREQELYRLKSEAEKEQDRVAMVKQANLSGAGLAENAPYDVALQEVVARRGKNLIGAYRDAGEAMNRYVAVTGRDRSQLAREQADMVVALAKDYLKVEDVELIRRDPQAVESLLKKYAATDHKRYRQLLDAVAQASQQLATKEAEEARASGRQTLQAAADEFEAKMRIVSDLVKSGPFDPEANEDARTAYRSAAFPQAAQAPGSATTQARPELPSSLLRQPGGPSASALPASAPGGYSVRGIIPTAAEAVMPAARSVAESYVRPRVRAAGNLRSILFGGQLQPIYDVPAAPAPSFATGGIMPWQFPMAPPVLVPGQAPPTPEQARLQQFINQQAMGRAMTTPLAFPSGEVFLQTER